MTIARGKKYENKIENRSSGMYICIYSGEVGGIAFIRLPHATAIPEIKEITQMQGLAVAPHVSSCRRCERQLQPYIDGPFSIRAPFPCLINLWGMAKTGRDQKKT
jgi:hypothetical protein